MEFHCDLCGVHDLSCIRLKDPERVLCILCARAVTKLFKEPNQEYCYRCGDEASVRFEVRPNNVVDYCRDCADGLKEQLG